MSRPSLQFHGRSHEKGTDGGLWGPKQREFLCLVIRGGLSREGPEYVA